MRRRYALLDDRAVAGPGFLVVLLMAFATLVAIGLVAGATIGVA